MTSKQEFSHNFTTPLITVTKLLPLQNEIVAPNPIFFALFDEFIDLTLILPYIQIMVRVIAGNALRPSC
jgi:hypothetical protein